ncbi:NAD(+) kinase [Photobacterium sp. WH77]|uniref:NAD(+) kinase n=1 Tax=Photobacterium TaxID=657 RepID=UPI00041458D9|nr:MULTISPECIES: NAD(+) kinase [Photobacterium]MCG2835578.1 NAD(+) kinase [Photobacterium sp. WH77]MCG2843191.1 NAD(+) kinase [Photobacterium sp. WH80]
MTRPFEIIALVGKPRNPDALHTHTSLYTWLTAKGYQVLVDHRLAHDLDVPAEALCDLLTIGDRASLAIVVGGDGNMLGAARVLSRFDISVIGVNRGNLGFLTDLDPDNFEQELEKVLDGEFVTEQRFLLEAEVHRHGQIKSRNTALNEAVLHPDKIAHMIEFEVYIDESFAFSQRSDGLIIATPTGSTAYSLSGGGPILSPSLNAITLVPMFPHTLSCRPLVVDGNRRIKLIVPDDGRTLEVSCDGQVSLPVSPGDEIHIYQSPDHLQLIHPKSYSYYNILRGKLGWSSKLF